MNYVILIWLLMLFAIPASAQLLTIRDEVTREALGQVALFSREPRVSAVTDAKGRVDIAPFERADSIRVEIIGYVREVHSYTMLASMNGVLFLKQTPFAMDEVVVSAMRWKQARSDVPARMITLSRSDAAMQNVQTSADLLAASGEIYVQKSQLGGGSPMIRGFSTNRVLLAVDGVRMNTAIFRGGNLQNVISIDPFALERTEIVFGPGSVMYGSDAIGGVMSFATHTPGFSYGGPPMLAASATLRSSSANAEKTGHLDVRLGLERWAFFSGVTYSDFGDLRMGKNGPDDYLRPEYAGHSNGKDSMYTNPDPLVQTPGGYHQLNLMQKIRFKPNDAWDLNYGAHYSTTGDFSRYDRLLRYRGSTLRSAEWYYGPQVWMMHALNAQHSDGGGFYDRMNVTAAYQLFEESRHDRDFGKTIRFNRSERVDALSLNLDMENELSPSDQVHYGVEILSNTVSSAGNDENIATGLSVPGPSRYPDGAVWNAVGAYADYRGVLDAGLILHGGLRYNVVTLDAEVDTTFFAFPFTEISMSNGSLNGSLGMVYSPGSAWQFSANLSSGFRAPNVDDAGKVFDSTPGYVIVPNPDLEPEYAYNAEISISKILSDVVKLHVTGYYTLLDNALVRRDFSFGGRDSLFYDGEMSRVQAIQNAALATVRGVQADFELRLPAGLGFVSRINYQQGEEELDDGSTAPLRHAPPWFGVTHLTWSLRQLELDCYSMYNGEVANADLAPEEQTKDYLYARDASGKPYSPTWYTLNFKARYRFSDVLTLTVGIENITDQRYRPYSSGITAPGLNVIGAVTVKI